MNSDMKPTTPLKAIKLFCVECFGGQARAVKQCTAPKCPLYEFRQGKNPYLKRKLTDEQRELLSLSFKNKIGKSEENIGRDT